MQCKICSHTTEQAFCTKILNRFDEYLYKCSNCGFLSYDFPHWLPMAYNEAINVSDTGLISRNLILYKLASIVAYSLLGKVCNILDWGGGTGMLVRLMRDIGFETYWQDTYCQNIFARGFEYNQQKIDLITNFEVFEHMPNPLDEICSILKISKNILFTTELIPSDIPDKNWYYYGFDHGQHISFYSLKTLQYIADKYNLYLSSNGYSIHLLTKYPYSNIKFKFICKFFNRGIFYIIKKNMSSKMVSDSIYLIEKSKQENKNI